MNHPSMQAAHVARTVHPSKSVENPHFHFYAAGTKAPCNIASPPCRRSVENPQFAFYTSKPEVSTTSASIKALEEDSSPTGVRIPVSPDRMDGVQTADTTLEVLANAPSSKIEVAEEAWLGHCEQNGSELTSLQPCSAVPQEADDRHVSIEIREPAYDLCKSQPQVAPAPLTVPDALEGPLNASHTSAPVFKSAISEKLCVPLNPACEQNCHQPIQRYDTLAMAKALFENDDIPTQEGDLTDYERESQSTESNEEETLHDMLPPASAFQSSGIQPALLAQSCVDPKPTTCQELDDVDVFVQVPASASDAFAWVRENMPGGSSCVPSESKEPELVLLEALHHDMPSRRVGKTSNNVKLNATDAVVDGRLSEEERLAVERMLQVWGNEPIPDRSGEHDIDDGESVTAPVKKSWASRFVPCCGKPPATRDSQKPPRQKCDGTKGSGARLLSLLTSKRSGRH